jgi:rhodanese-related sulfurtransferase
MTIKKLIYLLLALSLALFSACSEDSATEPEETPVDEFAVVAEVGDTYFGIYSGVNISMATLYDNLTDGDSGNDPFIVDLRGTDDYNAKHIVGAVNISLGDLMNKVDDGTIPDDQTVVFVCYTGQTASVATSVLNLMGYDAQNLLFGMCGVTSDPVVVPKSDRWQSKVDNSDWYALDQTDEGKPSTEETLPDPDTGQKLAVDIIKARFSQVWDWNDDSSADWGIGVSTLPDDLNNYFIINYWVAAEYLDPGHIEGAYQFEPKVDIQSDANLNKLPADQKIAVYCYTGQTSAQLTAYLRILGYEAYSVTYGVNGFAYSSLEGHTYSAPTTDYSSVLE